MPIAGIVTLSFRSLSPRAFPTREPYCWMLSSRLDGLGSRPSCFGGYRKWDRSTSILIRPTVGEESRNLSGAMLLCFGGVSSIEIVTSIRDLQSSATDPC
jgi:hypothetical protein